MVLEVQPNTTPADGHRLAGLRSLASCTRKQGESGEDIYERDGKTDDSSASLLERMAESRFSSAINKGNVNGKTEKSHVRW